MYDKESITQNYLLPYSDKEKEQLARQRNLNVRCLKYDFTPMNCVSMIMCEIGRLSPVSVPVIVEEFNQEREKQKNDE